jgi:hypothetical protein
MSAILQARASLGHTISNRCMRPRNPDAGELYSILAFEF